MNKLQALALVSLGLTTAAVASALPFAKGQLVEISSPTDLYRISRSLTLPAVVLAYAGEGGVALRDALALRASQVSDGLFLAIKLETALANFPPEVFRDSPLPELESGGMETIALAFNHSGERMRWTTVAGPESAELVADPASQAENLIAFMRT